MKIIDRGVVLAGAKGTDFQSLAFPGICVLPGGRWMCGMRASPTKGGTIGQQAVLTWSDDEGRSWREALTPFVPPVLDGRPGLFRAAYPTALGGSDLLVTLMWVDHSDPSLPFFNEETEGILDSRIFFARSNDNGATWSEPWPLDFGKFDVPLATTGPTLILANGDWACQFEVNKYYYSPETWRHSSVLMFSTDGGQSWPEYSIASNDPENRIFYWDQRPGLLADGTVLDAFWTYDNQSATYLNIHARQSTDNGRTWSELWDTGVPGQPAPPVSLSDGSIAMVYVDRTAAPTIKVRTSADQGSTWPDDTELILHQAASPSQTWDKGTMQDAWAEMGKFSLGLPATTLLPDGDVVVVYYSGPQTDETAIHWLRLRA